MFTSTHSSSVTHPFDPVSRVMVWPVAVVHTDDSLREVAQALAADEVGALGVLDGSVLIGVVSERDLVEHLARGAHPDHVTAGEMMSTDLVVGAPSDTVLDVALRMRAAGVRHLPIKLDDRLAGIVSLRDVVGVLSESASHDSSVVVASGTRVFLRQE